jgi:hypothetical protein
MALGAGVGDAAADGHRLQRVRQRRLSGAADADRRITDNKGKRAAQRPPPLDESLRALDARNAFVMSSCCRK